MPIAIAVMAVAGIVFANVIASKNRPKTENELMAEAQMQAEQESKNAPPTEDAKVPMGKPTAPMPTTLKEANDLAALGPDIVLPGGKPEKTVTVGYAWTPELQGDPSVIARIVEKVKAAAPDAQVRLVNVDETPGVAPGVSVNKTVVAPPGADGNLGETAGDAAAAELKKAK
jgi:hypothetical protein